MCPSCYRYIFVPNQLFVIFVMLEWCLTTLLTKSNVDIEVWPSHSVSVITHIEKNSSSKWEANPELSFEMWLRKRSLPPMNERALCRICQDGASFVALHYFSMYDTYNIWEHTSSDKPTPFSVSGLHNISFYQMQKGQAFHKLQEPVKLCTCSKWYVKAVMCSVPSKDLFGHLI